MKTRNNIRHLDHYFVSNSECRCRQVLYLYILGDWALQLALFFCRKRKLTNHWQNFIRPLMWRCKWTELRIKEIESQALKYSRALAVYEQGKNSGLDPTMEDFSSKAFPFSNQYYRRKAMKRRKRKRSEDTNDISSYMSQHNLFSYYGTSFKLLVITSCVPALTSYL